VEKAKYCVRCGGLLKERRIGGRIRLVCEKCSYVHYRNPIPTVDIIIKKDEGIVLVNRNVDYGESLEDAAIREAKEETNLDINTLKQFHTYSDPKRDPRCHTVSTVFIGKGEGELKASDDAKEVRIFKKEEIPSGLAFDHKRILEDYFKYGQNRPLPGKL